MPPQRSALIQMCEEENGYKFLNSECLRDEHCRLAKQIMQLSDGVHLSETTACDHTLCTICTPLM